MGKFAIIGSGVVGLLCAHGLREAGNEVTLYSDRTAESWLTQSRPTGLAGRFEMALSYERELGLNHWEAQAPGIQGVQLTLCPTLHNRLLTATGRVSPRGMAVDVRLQSHGWMRDLVARGGKVEIEEVTVPKLEEIARGHDLTIVSTGKGGLASLFPRNEARSVYTQPQRQLAMVAFKGPGLYVDGIPFQALKYKLLPFAGEVFWTPFHHKDIGPSWMILFEAKAGGPMDRFRDVKSAKELLDVARQTMKDLVPWEYDWFKDAEISDENGWLVGTVTPAVRSPVGKLPSGQVVMPLGDTAVAVDPIAGQGANNGVKMARHLVESIAAAGDRPFDAAWMTDTFERFWTMHSQHSVNLTNALLEPPSPTVAAYLIAQYGSDGREGRTDGRQALADAFGKNFADPSFLTPALLDPPKLRAFIRQTTGSFVRSVAKGVPGIVRAQIRQRLGKDPGHPVVADATAT